MSRKHYTFGVDDKQLIALKDKCIAEGVTVPDLMRSLIGKYLAGEFSLDAPSAVQEPDDDILARVYMVIRSHPYLQWYTLGEHRRKSCEDIVLAVSEEFE